MRRASEHKMWGQLLAEVEAEQRNALERYARRVAKGTAAKPRPVCTCPAYPWPHRPRGGNCRHPDPPAKVHPGKASSHAPALVRRHGSIRQRILRTYSLHPIRDRQRVRRWLPKLYVATCRRKGFADGFWLNGRPTPAMRITATTPMTGYPADPWLAWQRRTDGREYHTNSPARRRRYRQRATAAPR